MRSFLTPSANLLHMDLGLLLIVVGIVLALLVSYLLGVIVILVGLALLIAPRLRS